MNDLQESKKYYGYTIKQLLCCIVCYFIFIAFGFTDASKSVYFPLIQKFYHLDYDYQGWLVFSSCIGYTIFSLFVGYLSIRIGIKYTLACGLVITIISFICSCLVVNIWILLASLIVAGIGMVFLDVGTNTWATSLFNSHKAVMLNLLHCNYGLGAAIGPLLTGMLSKKLNIGYRGVFIGILLVLSLALIFVVFIPKIDEMKTEERKNDKSNESTFTILSALKHPVVILLGITQGCIAGTENITMNWSPIYFRDMYGWDPETRGAQFIFVFFIGYTISRVFCGFIIDAIGEAWSMLILCSLLEIAYIGGFLLKENGFILLKATGVFIAPLFPTLLTIAMIYFGKDAPKCTCVILFTYMIISQIIQCLVGFINKYIGFQWGYRFSVILIGMVMVNILIVKRLLDKKQRNEKELALEPLIKDNIDLV